jgi:3-methylcrotonyl-CoA carboxylase alpha subunit
VIQKLLVANRGEIAVRIARTARAMGIVTVAVFSDADAEGGHLLEFDESIHIGPAPASESYLNQDAVLSAAVTAGADAIHPGYGFLAENAQFAERVIAAGLTWVGPTPTAMRMMGLKIEARRLAEAAGVAVIPGFDGSQDAEDMAAAAENLGYPVMLKASAGGGGKGIRIAAGPEDFDTALREATDESSRAFGDSDMIVEQYITQPRHVEVQIVGDSVGSLIHLGTRECSLQRKHQKVIEEAPAVNLSEKTRTSITTAAVTLGSSIGYENAGTVEFIVDAETEEFFFLEMNTRLQVEHPVTEEITGLDLVELQLLVAAGSPLPLKQDEVRLTGHAFEARINAEDPSAGFMPQTGPVFATTVPDGIRWETGLISDVSPYYDSMLAKLVVYGDTRDVARKQLVRALEGLHLAGPGTNQGFLHWLLQQPEVVAGTATTRFVDEIEFRAPVLPTRALGAAAGLVREAQVAVEGPWGLGLRLTPHRRDSAVFLGYKGVTERVLPETTSGVIGSVGPTHAAVTMGGETYTFERVSREQAWRSEAVGSTDATSEFVTAPFPGLIATVDVEEGQSVAAGDLLVTLEAMKMLHPVKASGSGVVASVLVVVGATVGGDAVLVRFEQPKASNKE